jgi:mycofactocin precursor
MTQMVTECADVLDGTVDGDAPVVGTPPAQPASVEAILEDELVEDVSIDGMCGVY